VGLLEAQGIGSGVTPILRAIDKFDKVGLPGVLAELQSAAGLTQAQAERVATPLLLSTADASSGSDPGAQLDALAKAPVPQSPVLQRGIDELRAVLDGARAAGVGDSVRLDLSIARGLDYYTGTIVETSLGALPGIGSVCSGGRYDDLANLYTKTRLPGIGASLGLDRLLSALEELGKLPKTRATAPVFLPFFDEARLTDYVAFCALLRRAGFGVEFYPEPRKLKAQLQYADRRGFSAAIVIGGDEWTAGTCQVKDLANGESAVVARVGATGGAPSAQLVERLGIILRG
jgi:histidyl-tRNA synthetase